MMNVIQKRFLLFLVGCMGTRFFIAYLAKILPSKCLQIMGFLALMPAIAFAYIFITGSRKTGAEVFGEEIWWNNLRPVHSFLYFCFAYFAINKITSIAWKFLLVDACVGLSSFIIYHYTSKSYKNLI